MRTLLTAASILLCTACSEVPAMRRYRIEAQSPLPQQPILSISPHPKSLIHDLSFNPDASQCVVAEDADGNGAVVWLLSPRLEKRLMLPHKGIVAGATWSQDGKYILTSDQPYPADLHNPNANGSVRLWDANTGTLIREVETPLGEWPQSVALSRDSTFIAWTTINMYGDMKLVVMSLASGKMTSVDFHGITFLVACIRFSDDARRIYYREYGWNFTADEQHMRLEDRRNYRFPLLAYSPNSRIGYAVAHRFASDKTKHPAQALYAIDLDSADVVAQYTFSNHAESMQAIGMAVSPDGNLVAVATESGVRVVDVARSGQFGFYILDKTKSNGIPFVRRVLFSSSGQMLGGSSPVGVGIWPLLSRAHP